MTTQAGDAADDATKWSAFLSELESLRKETRAHRAATVGRQSSREHVKSVVHRYFSGVRPHLLNLGFTDAELGPLDDPLQELIQLANGVSSKAAYARVIRETKKQLSQVEVTRAMRLGLASGQPTEETDARSQVEEAILHTLRLLEPGAALGYEQALRDIQDENRLSYRGVASELREVVREVLDRLAPDKDLQQADVKLDKDRNDYTHKQKVRHILKARGVGETKRKVPEESIQLIEELTASLARSIYERGSLSTHGSSPRSEVQQLKLYVDGVLGELLEIHTERRNTADGTAAE